MMIESVEVKNYKIIDYLKVENLTNINVFVGKNNCGKTSLLEAMFLNFQPTNPRLIHDVISRIIRRISPNYDNLEWFFHKMNIQKCIEIISVYNNEKMYLKITPKLPDNSTFKIVNDMDDKQDSNNIYSPKAIFGLDFKVKFNGKSEVKCGFTIENIDNQYEIKGGVIPNYPSFAGLFMPSNGVSLNVILSDIIEEIRKLKKEKDLNKYLAVFDKQILDVEVMGNEIMLNIADMPKRVSIKVMGEGFKKYLLIVGSLILGKHQYICIDEIENGLHFESMEKLIDSIIKLSKVAKIQLFISTHSYEFLEILNNIALEKKSNNIAVFNLKKTNENLQTRRYDMADLKHLLNTEVEFRK